MFPTRRSFLRIGALSFGGLSLPGMLKAQADSPTSSDVNCIMLWTEGGLSNIDTFDMKPDAPAEYRGEFKAIPSTVPGSPVCEHLPFMATQMHQVCL